MIDEAKSLYVSSYFIQSLFMGDINRFDRLFLEVCHVTNAYYDVLNFIKDT